MLGFLDCRLAAKEFWLGYWPKLLKSCIYEHILTGNEKFLNIRAFTDKMKREAHEKQKVFVRATRREQEKEMGN